MAKTWERVKKRVLGIGGILGAAEDNETLREQQGLIRFWLKLVNQHQRLPVAAWQEAQDQYDASGDFEKKSNWPRLPVWKDSRDTEMAYIDQIPPDIGVSPHPARQDDEEARAAAACDEALLAYIQKEQCFAKQFSMALLSAEIKNNGYVVHIWDSRKWLPDIRYVDNTQVAWDPDCGPQTKHAGWCAWVEWVSPYEVSKWRATKDVALKELQRVAQEAPAPKAGDERDRTPEEQRTFKKCKLWHIFARGQAALYETEPSGEGTEPPTPRRASADEGEPKRYLEIVEGPGTGPGILIRDDNEWPFVLDYDEWPITMLTFNQSLQNIYGTGDYRYQYRMGELLRGVVADWDRRLALKAYLKFLGRRGVKIDPVKINAFFNSPNVELLEEMLDEEGRPLIAAFDLGDVSADLVQAIGVAKQMYEETTTQADLKRLPDPGAFKTAFQAQQAGEAAHAKPNRRLRTYETFLVKAMNKTLQIAHQKLEPLTQIKRPIYAEEVLRDEAGEPVLDDLGQMVIQPTLDADGNRVIMDYEPPVSVSYERARIEREADPEIKILRFGVDAIVGAEKAATWQQMSPEEIRASVFVYLEHGGTQRQAKMQKASALEQLMTSLMPFYLQIGRPDLVANLVKRIMELLQIQNIDELVPEGTELEQQQNAPGPGGPVGNEPQGPGDVQGAQGPGGPDVGQRPAVEGSGQGVLR